MKRILAFVAMLATLLVVMPARATTPPILNLDLPWPPGMAILYCVDSTSGPPFKAYACDATHPLFVSVVSGGSGGGGVVTVADGADVAQGTTTDTAWTSGAGTTISLEKALDRDLLLLSAKFPASLGIKTSAGSFSITPASDATFAVTGTFWQTTQPISSTQLPSTLGIKTAANSFSIAPASDATFTVTGTFWQATQPVSEADGAFITFGAKADAKSTATDTTAITAMQVLKEISFMEQTPASRAVTNPGTFAVQPGASTSGGISASGCNAVVPNNTTGVSCKGSAGQVYHLSLYNNSATVAYVKLYDKATAPTCGTDTPTSRRMIPANGGLEADIGMGGVFSTGIGYCVTTGIADNDTTAPAASTYLVNIYYK